jgi:hypothetical protein
LIGRTTAGKDFLLQLVCSPDQDGEAPIHITSVGSNSSSAKQKTSGSKGASSGGSRNSKLTLDEEWIVEHAAQAARTLPGGLDILGIYILCDEKTFQAGQGVIINSLKKINQEISSLTATAAAIPLLALHIDSITAKIVAREVSGASLRMCEVKPSNLVANMVEAQCQFQVDLKVNLGGGKQRLHDAIRDAVIWQTEHRLHSSVALINDQILDSSQQIVDVLKNGGNCLSLELLTPLSMPPVTLAAVGTNTSTDLPPSITSGKGEYQRQAEFALTGALDCRAFVHKREPLSAAINAIKGDVERTLLTRIDILVEAAQMATDEAQARFNATTARDLKSGKQPTSQGAQAPKHPLLIRVAGVDVYKPTFPRRAFLKWAQGGCSFCDYIVEGEGMSEAVQRVQELMGADSVNPSTFQCEEKLAAGVLAGRGAGAGRGKRGNSGFECNVATAGAISFALLAMYLSWSLMS